MMKVLFLQASGTPYKLAISTTQKPEPEPGDVRIRTVAASLNPVDYKFAKNGHFLPKPHVLGIDIAGIVDKTGSDVTRFKEGDRVFGLLNLHRWGSFAEFALADEQVLCRIPDTMSFEQASTIPCAGITAWQALFEKAHIQKGQHLLVTAGGGGVGGFVIQMAKKAGLTVYATASTHPEHLQSLGADHIIDYKNESINDRVMVLSNGRGIDHVIDLVSATSAESHLPVLRHNGSVVCIAGRIDTNPTAKFAKAISFHEVALGFAYQHGDSENLRDIARGGSAVASAMEDGSLDPMISKTIDLQDIPAALSEIEDGHVKGKIVAQIG